MYESDQEWTPIVFYRDPAFLGELDPDMNLFDLQFVAWEYPLRADGFVLFSDEGLFHEVLHGIDMPIWFVPTVEFETLLTFGENGPVFTVADLTEHNGRGATDPRPQFNMESHLMSPLFVISYIVLWIAVSAAGFLLLGTLRSLGLLQWRIDQLEATRPGKINREGLKPGKTAPDFTLPQVGGGECSLSDYRGRRVFLVFVQAGCQPCHEIAPELNRLQRSGEMQVLVINRADPEEAAAWADDVRADCPVLVQSGLDISKKYEVFATPFAFVIDAQGRIASSGVVSRRRYLGFVLDAADKQLVEPSSVDEDATDCMSASKLEAVKV